MCSGTAVLRGEHQINNKMNILENSKDFKCIVSSVLNKDPKQYGKKYMFDHKEDTSWSSSQVSRLFC